MFKRIIVINTTYSLLQYIAFDKEWRTRDYLLLSSRIPKKVLDTFIPLTHKTYIYETTGISFRMGLKSIYTAVSRHKEILKIIKPYKEVYGNLELLFDNLQQSTQVHIDDGLLTYEMLRCGNDFRFSSTQGKIIRLLHSCFGLRRKFQVTNPQYQFLLPDHNSYRAFKERYNILFYNLPTLWSEKSSAEKQQIYDIFNTNELDFDNIKERKIILFTQPLSEDGLCDEQEKINHYLDLIKKEVTCVNDLVIKPHPSDKTDYKKLFPAAHVMDSIFPSELLTLAGVTFHKSITLFSTSAKTVLAKEIVFQGSSASLRSQNNILGERIFCDI